jgi:predicted nuclease of predicted toxin-antitoxin system
MSALAIKLDENLRRSHARFLRDLGYKADRVLDQGLSGASDEAVWERGVSEGRFLITLDLDFSDIRRFQPGSHPGILLIRARSKSREAVLEVLRRVLAEQPLEELRGCLAVADQNFTRVRRPVSE